jgi:hypothetical protein
VKKTVGRFQVKAPRAYQCKQILGLCQGLSPSSKWVRFELCALKSFYKGLFQGKHLGETLKKMSLSKALPEGLKTIKCEHGIGGKNSLIHYIHEQEPTYFNS